MPTHVIFLAIIYPIFGLFLACMTFGYDVMPLLFPLVAGSMFRGSTPSECCDAVHSTASPLSEWSW
jgi:uncharacterized membrane protein